MEYLKCPYDIQYPFRENIKITAMRELKSHLQCIIKLKAYSAVYQILPICSL